MTVRIMKKVLIIMISLVFMTGCVKTENVTDSADTNTKEQYSSRFVNIERQTEWDVVYDRETLVVYTVSENGFFTVLMDKDGNPLLYKENQE